MQVVVSKKLYVERFVYIPVIFKRVWLGLDGSEHQICHQSGNSTVSVDERMNSDQFSVRGNSQLSCCEPLRLAPLIKQVPERRMEFSRDEVGIDSDVEASLSESTCPAPDAGKEVAVQFHKK